MSDYPTKLTDKQRQVIKNIVETNERKTFFTRDDKCDDVPYKEAGTKAIAINISLYIVITKDDNRL